MHAVAPTGNYVRSGNARFLRLMLVMKGAVARAAGSVDLAWDPSTASIFRAWELLQSIVVDKIA